MTVPLLDQVVEVARVAIAEVVVKRQVNTITPVTAPGRALAGQVQIRLQVMVPPKDLPSKPRE